MITRLAVFACACAAVTVTGQQPLQLEIVFPPDGAYVSDRLTIEARVLPAERRGEITELTFFADGQLICRTTNIQRPQCAWDAGAVVKP